MPVKLNWCFNRKSWHKIWNSLYISSIEYWLSRYLTVTQNVFIVESNLFWCIQYSYWLLNNRFLSSYSTIYNNSIDVWCDPGSLTPPTILMGEKSNHLKWSFFNRNDFFFRETSVIVFGSFIWIEIRKHVNSCFGWQFVKIPQIDRIFLKSSSYGKKTGFASLNAFVQQNWLNHHSWLSSMSNNKL